MPIKSLPLVAQAADHEVSAGIVALFGLLLAGMIACLAFEEKLHAKKSVIAAVFAVASLLLGAAFHVLPPPGALVGSHEVPLEGEAAQRVDELLDEVEGEGDHADLHEGGHEVAMPLYIPAIDWGVIVILLGSSVFVDVVSRSGLFKWLAIKVTKFSHGDPLLLLAYYGVMTVVFSAVLNNVTAMIIVGSLSAVSLDKLGRKDQLFAFLLTEGLLTNIGGLLTLISSVPNIIVGTAAKISFMSFVFYSAPYVAAATAATLWLAAKMFGIRRLGDGAEKLAAKAMVDGFDENDEIASHGFFWFGAIATTLFIVTIALTSELPWISDLGIGFVAVAFASIAMLRFKAEADKIYRIVDWDLLGFFVGLFIVIYVMEYAGVLNALGSALALLIDLGPKLGAIALLFASAVCSSVTDNIPLAAVLAKMLTAQGTPSESPLWWAVALGANLGGNLTPIGSASTLVAVAVMHKHAVPMTFMGFVKAASPFAVMQLTFAGAYLLATN